MKLRRMIKQKARAALNGNRGGAVALIMVSLAVSLIINMVDAAAMQLLGYEFTMEGSNVFTYSSDFFYNIPAMVVSLVTWLVRLALVVPLGYGILGWHLELTDRRRQGVAYIFWPYESKAALRGVMLSLNITVKLFLVSCLLLVLPFGILFAGDMPGISEVLSMTLIYSGMALVAVALLLMWAFAQRFAVARILLCEKYQLTVHQAVKQSVCFTKGHLWELVRFELSFLPWILPLFGASVMLTFSLAFDSYSMMPLVWLAVFILVSLATYIWLTPYYTMAQVMYARYLYEYGVWQQGGENAAVHSRDASAEADIPREPEVVPVQPMSEPRAEQGTEPRIEETQPRAYEQGDEEG